MTDAPCRRWFQLHLSTVIALTVTAGALMFMNVCPRLAKHSDIGAILDELDADGHIRHSSMSIYNNWQGSVGTVHRYG
jgi:hypothetical protein